MVVAWQGVEGWSVGRAGTKYDRRHTDGGNCSCKIVITIDQYCCHCIYALASMPVQWGVYQNLRQLSFPSVVSNMSKLVAHGIVTEDITISSARSAHAERSDGDAVMSEVL